MTEQEMIRELVEEEGMSDKPNTYAEDVGSVFYMYHEHDDGRECVTADLAEQGAEEMARQFEQAEAILQGFLRSAESINVGLYLCLSDAVDRARLAQEASEKYARRATA